MKYNQKGSVFVYTLILVMLALSMAMIIRSNIGVLEDNFQITENKNNFLKNIDKKAQYFFAQNKYYNSNGGAIIDRLSCPNNIVMSGSTIRNANISTTLTASGSELICRGTYNSQNLDILFSADSTTFDTAKWGSNPIVNLSGQYSKSGINSFADWDSTNISFNSAYYYSGGGADNIDDNINSDDYTAGSSIGNDYPGDIIDDDILGKIHKTGSIKNGVWQNIFWNNSKIEEYISGNPNNNSTKTTLLGTSSGSLFIDIPENIQLNIAEFDKEIFKNTGELIMTYSHILDVNSGSGYLQSNGTLSPNSTSNDFLFDFSSKDYSLLAKNNFNNYISYSLHFIDNNGKYIISLPIKDDHPVKISVLAYDMMLDNTGRYMYTIKEFFDVKY